MHVWRSNVCDAWHTALERYAETIRKQQVRGLVEADAWYREELPAQIAARRPAYITLTELSRTAVWKMKRGVWRERNRQLLHGNPPLQVRRISKAAFAAVPDPSKPVALLSTLAGVGPATASAVLACY